MPDKNNSNSEGHRVIIMAIGNRGRGDHALPHELMSLLRSPQERRPDWLTVIVDTELLLEHTMDLRGHELALFITVSGDAQNLVNLSELELAADAAPPSTEGPLSMVEILRTMNTLGRGAIAPISFQLTLAGSDFTDDAAISATGQASLGAAQALLDDLLGSPGVETWRNVCEGYRENA